MVGMTLAAATSTAGIATTLIEAESSHDLAEAKFDGRSSAIAYGSKQVLAAVGAWRYLEADAAPIREIRVSDGGWREACWHSAHESPFFVHYKAGDLPPSALPRARLRPKSSRRSLDRREPRGAPRPAEAPRRMPELTHIDSARSATSTSAPAAGPICACRTAA